MRWAIPQHASAEAIPMKPILQFRLVAVAFLISLALNGIMLAIDFSIDPRHEKLSTIDSIVVALLKPSEALTMWLAPGHGGAQILVLAASSVLVYTVLALVVLSLPMWWRRRT